MAATEAPPAAPAPRDDLEELPYATANKIATGLITGVPILALGLIAWRAAEGNWLGWSDVLAFGVTYLWCATGITVGFHRLFTHRAFKMSAAGRFWFAVAGSAAIEGPVISWVADHRKHHAFSDHEGDPHSPHVTHEGGVIGAFKGLWHAHWGWIFLANNRGSHQRYAKDLLNDPVVRFVDRTFLVWVLVGLAVPFGIGWLVGGSIDSALTGLLWGGAVRMLLLHHVTYSINSLCHFFGKRRFDTDDESRNLAWLAPFSLGESWHHNHHAFPTSAHHGMRWYELDVSSLIIRAMKRVGLAWDVVEISRERQDKRAAA